MLTVNLCLHHACTHMHVCDMTHTYTFVRHVPAHVCHDDLTRILPHTHMQCTSLPITHMRTHAHFRATILFHMWAITVSYANAVCFAMHHITRVHTHTHTHTHMQHDSFICVPWQLHMHTSLYIYAYTHTLYTRTQPTSLRVIQKYMCDMTLSHVWHDCRIYAYAHTLYFHAICVRIDICAAWLFRVCDLTVAHAHAVYVATRHVCTHTDTCVHTHRHTCATWLFHMCDMTAPYAYAQSSCGYAPCTQRHMSNSFTCVTWLPRTHSHTVYVVTHHTSMLLGPMLLRTTLLCC